MSGIDSKAAPDRDRQDESSMRARSDQFSRALFGLLLVLGALVYRDLLFWDTSDPRLHEPWWFLFRISETAPQLLFVLAVPLFYRRRKRIARALRGEAAPRFALPFLALGMALFLWGHYANALDLALASLLAVTLGSALLLSGQCLARELMLPLLFLAFAIPLPAVLTNQLIYPLQLINAAHTGWLLNAIGIAAVQEESMLYLAGHSVQVIETCSGLRSAFVLTTLAVGWLCFFPARRLPAALLIVSAPAIAYLVNILRILGLVLNPSSDLASLHSLQGAGIFLLGVLILYGVDSLLRRIPGGSEARIGEPETAPPLHAAWDRHGYATALAVVLAAMLGVSLWGPRWSPPEPTGRPSVKLPRAIDGWRVSRSLKPDYHFLGSVAFRSRWHREYERGGETVSVFIGYDDRLDRSRSLISPKNAVPGADWNIEERTLIQLAPSGLGAESVLARSGTTRTLNFHWYQGIAPLALEVLRACLATDQSSLRRPDGAWVVRLSTNVRQTRDGKKRAEARLRGFAELLAPRVEKFLIQKRAPRPDGPGRSGS
jgi:EpsI family protein